MLEIAGAILLALLALLLLPVITTALFAALFAVTSPLGAKEPKRKDPTP